MKYTPEEISESPAMSSETMPDKLFDVTMTVGSVYSGGSMSPYVAAFYLIGTVERNGEYSFPTADGGITRVSVKSEPE